MTPADPARVVDDIAARLGDRDGDALTASAVEALDVLTHALAYSQTRDARSVWLEALRSGKLNKPGEASIACMVIGLNEALRDGDEHRVLDLCDCLETVFSEHRTRSVVRPPL